MTKLLIITIAIGILAVAGSAFYYFAVALPKIQSEKHIVESQRLQQLEKNAQETKDKEAKLNNCLEEAKQRAKDLFILNSYESSQKDYPDARRWNSIEIQKQTEEKYNEDRDFCLKLYN